MFRNHCSNHVYQSNGCIDCNTAALVFGLEKTSNNFIASNNLQIKISIPSPKMQLIRQQLARAIAVFFSKEKHKAANAAVHKAQAFIKAELTDEQKVAILFAANDAIQWELLVNAVKADILAAAQSGAQDGFNEIQEMSDSAKAAVEEEVEKYAENRAAEMIGMKYSGNSLIINPEARFIISNTTSDDLKDVIEQSVVKHETLEEMKERIIRSATFSDVRSQLISKTETAFAQVQGHVAVWKAMEKVTKVDIRLSDSHIVVDECDTLAAGGPYPIETMPLIPAHPNCQCTIVGVK